MTIVIFGNTMKPGILDEVKHIIEFVEARGVHVLLSHELRQEPEMHEYAPFPEDWDGTEQPNNYYGEDIDFALSVGGDGTFLTTAAHIGNKNIPILGINCGRLGFLADVKTSDTDSIISELISGNYTIEQRSLLHVSCAKEGLIMAPFALNEIAILKQGFSSMITIDVQVNDELLHSYKADGLVFATPTGSTAYNLSAGGPLMVPQARGIILTPIATHSLSVRPLVVPDDWKFDIKVSSRYANYMMSIDGRSQILSDDITLHIERAPYTIKVVQVGSNSFLQSLRSKMGWGK